MGHLAQSLARPDAALLDDLVRAYADEWHAHYNYFYVGKMVHGPSSASIAALLSAKSEDACARATRLADRILELGGRLVEKLTDLPAAATDKPFKLPEDLGDTQGLLAAVLDADRTSMRTFQRIYDRTREGDPVTAALVLALLTEATQGERQLERLLSSDMVEKDGT